MYTSTSPMIERLLVETFAAHSEYERTTLEGDYDEEWPEWYASYLLAHGLHLLIPRAANLDASQLGSILERLHRDYTDQGQVEDWRPWYAQRLGALVEQAGHRR